jgi:esterase/lipase
MKSGNRYIKMMKVLILLLFFYSSVEANELLILEEKIRGKELLDHQKFAITEGAEKAFLWQNLNNPQKTEYAILYLHGFSASRKEVEPLPQLLAKHYQANLYLNRLTSHGQKKDLFKDVLYSDWINDVEKDLQIAQQIGEKVIILATSTGATLATYLATQYPDKIHGLIFLSPLFGAADGKSELLTNSIFGPLMLKLFLGEFREWVPENELQGKYWKHYYYSRAVRELVYLVQEVRSLDLESIQTPSCWYYTDKDEVVSVKKLLNAYNRFGSIQKSILNFKEAKGHVLAGDILNPAGTAPLLQEIISCASKFL